MHISNQSSPDFGFDIIDINSVETELKDGTVVMYMESSSSDDLANNYVPFNQDDYWYWGWDLGKCNGYQGVGDAADKLEYKFNHPIMPSSYYYFTDVVIILVEPTSQYYDPNNPYGEYMLFRKTGPGANPPEEPCMIPDELNYYLNKFDYIKNLNKPQDKFFKCVEVIDDIIIGSGWGRIHKYDLYYGIPTAHD
ncbi:MAG: hypothetical protein ISS19_18915 [Bacteroidales bacterium]|nr:hypothetical protein [Bacteroidales bacterium]